MNQQPINQFKLLGKRKATFRWRYLYPLMLTWFALCTGCGLLTGLGGVVNAIIFFAIGVGILWSIHPRVIVFENGFVSRDFNQVATCYWLQIRLIHDFSDDRGLVSHLTITHSNGFDIDLSTKNYSRFDTLATAILQRHLDVNLDDHLKGLRGGNWVRFWLVEIYADHIVGGTHRVLIDAIKSVRFEPDGRVQLRVKDDFDALKWIELSQSWIPNRHLMQQLIVSLQTPSAADETASDDPHPIKADEESQATNLEFATKTYRTGAISRRQGIVMLEAFALLMLPVLIVSLSSWLLTLLMAFSLITGLWALANYFLMQPVIVTLDPIGISLYSKTVAQRLNWVDITAIYDQFDPSGAGGSDMRLVREHGGTLDIPLYLVKRNELIEHIHDIFADLHLPPSIQALDNGETLTFGPCTISRSTLIVDGKLIEIEDISSVEINRKGIMHIQVETAQESRQYSTDDLIPNRHLLIDIITHLRLRAESRVVFSSERLQLEDSDEPMIISHLENRDTLDSTK